MKTSNKGTYSFPRLLVAMGLVPTTKIMEMAGPPGFEPGPSAVGLLRLRRPPLYPG